jgi:hypothetical protein
MSAAVLDELRNGDYPNKEACLSLVEALPLLQVNREVLEIARVYQQRGLMPKPPSADALHLALASFYRMDSLLTWNCRHIANANKTKHLELLNHGMGLPVSTTIWKSTWRICATSSETARTAWSTRSRSSGHRARPSPLSPTSDQAAQTPFGAIACTSRRSSPHSVALSGLAPLS